MLKKIPDSIQSFHHDYHEVELDLETIYLIRIFALKYLNRLDPPACTGSTSSFKGNQVPFD